MIHFLTRLYNVLYSPFKPNMVGQSIHDDSVLKFPPSPPPNYILTKWPSHMWNSWGRLCHPHKNVVVLRAAVMQIFPIHTWLLLAISFDCLQSQLLRLAVLPMTVIQCICCHLYRKLLLQRSRWFIFKYLQHPANV